MKDHKTHDSAKWKWQMLTLHLVQPVHLHAALHLETLREVQNDLHESVDWKAEDTNVHKDCLIITKIEYTNFHT